MNTVLRQRRLLTTMTFTLTSDGVDVVERSPTFKKTFRIPYAHIPSRFAYVAIGSSLWLWACVLLAVISIGTGIAALFHLEVERFAWLVWGLLALGAGAVFLAKRKTFRVFQGGETPLVMFDGLPNKIAFDSFLSELHRLRLKWLTNRIVAELGGQPVKLRRYLSDLRDTGFLSDAEVQELSDRLADWSPLDPRQTQFLN